MAKRLKLLGGITLNGGLIRELPQNPRKIQV